MCLWLCPRIGKNARGCDFEPLGVSRKGESRTYISAGLALLSLKSERDGRNVLLFTCSAGFDAGSVFLSEELQAFLTAQLSKNALSPLFYQKILSQVIKRNPHSSLKSQIMHYNHIISNPALSLVLLLLPSSSLILIWTRFIFSSRGPAAPLRTCTLDAPWQMSTASLFSQPCILYV